MTFELRRLADQLHRIAPELGPEPAGEVAGVVEQLLVIAAQRDEHADG
ncbi:MAG: hypothetical protein AB7G37_06435 [Solirubrobacteraceae bacterium]